MTTPGDGAVTGPRGSGVGSMPGVEFAAALRDIGDELGLPFLPELPARGVHAGMIGRSLGILSGLGADLQPDGWRLGVGEGRDQRRARSTLRQDLDLAEEAWAEHTGPLKVQVTGPLTLAATVERPLGDKLVGDHGARREVSESLAEGLVEHVADVRRRFAGREVLVQVDEPSLPAVLAGRIPTASGLRTHRTVHPPEADELLRRVAEAITDAGAVPVVHCCAPDVPVALLAGAGFRAILFDLSLAGTQDHWAEAFDSGVDLWPGVVPSGVPDGVSDTVLVERIRRFFGRYGYAAETVAPRLTVTPTCGLAGAEPAWAGRALRVSQQVAEHVGERR